MGLFDWFKRDKISQETEPEIIIPSEELLEALENLKKKEVRIQYQQVCGETLDITASKIGGKPAVPVDFVWPRYKGEGFDGVITERPLTFMAQINLKDVAMYDEEGLLPKTGILSFFYELITMKWGFEPEDKGCARVFYFPEEMALQQMDIPQDLEEDVRIPECKVSFEEHVSLPGWEDFEGLGNGDVDLEEYEVACSQLGYDYDDMGEYTKLLGYPDVIQNPMEEECETLRRGFRNGSPTDSAKISQQEKVEIKEKSKEWMLLFQMGTITTDETEVMFGDCGHIYFWIRKQDLQVCDFDAIWLILQCG